MVLLRRVIGDALRTRRQSQRRTLREVSTAANVSLGYLSEIERGQKEASSELLLAICDALGAAQSEVLRMASDSLALAEMGQLLGPIGDVRRLESNHLDVPHLDPKDLETRQADGNRREPDYLEQGHAETAIGEPSGRGDNPALAVDVAQVVEGEVSVAVCRNGPLRAALRSQCPQSVREVVRAA